MQAGPPDLAQVRLDNALALFEEFVRVTARHADAATLRGLERRFAERVDIQPSYWSQIKGRSRQIGERLARQFEQRCGKPAGWLDRVHAPGEGAAAAVPTGPAGPAGAGAAVTAAAGTPEHQPLDEDERFIVGLVLTYYRRHPQRARTRLLDLLGEVLTPPPPTSSPPHRAAGARPTAPKAPAGAAADDGGDLWRRAQRDVAPLKPRR
jgi:hypothetical protein